MVTVRLELRDGRLPTAPNQYFRPVVALQMNALQMKLDCVPAERVYPAQKHCLGSLRGSRGKSKVPRKRADSAFAFIRRNVFAVKKEVAHETYQESKEWVFAAGSCSRHRAHDGDDGLRDLQFHKHDAKL